MARLFDHLLQEHKLILQDEKKLDTDDVKMNVCGVCGFLMFINPYYRCSKEGCNFSVHEQCTELPQKITNFDFHSTCQDLNLLSEKQLKKKKRCSKCGKISNNFMYRALGRYQNSYFHPFCASPKEIKTTHRSHYHDPMTPTHKMISAFCDACGEEFKDHFLSCQACDYWIHKECALLPSIGMHTSHTDHPLILLYSNPFSKKKSSWGDCESCQKDIPIENAVYTCQACSYFVHIKCVKSQIKPLTQEESKKQIIDLPPGEEEYEVFPSLLIRNEVQGFHGDESNRVITKWMTPEVCHNTHHHSSLIFHGKEDHSAGVCNACIRPISTSYYKCSSETVCRFIIHESCANLPKTIPKKFNNRGMHLLTEWTSNTLRAFYCDICNRWCNGFGYSSDEEPADWSFVADVKCASAPRIIKHQSHNHILHLIESSSFDYTQHFSCCTSGYTDFLYMCIICDFKIHVSCALLPKKVSDEFDDHPLQLITNNNIPKKEDNFCDFCEEDIDLKFWFYNCDKCDQSFHVKCIPSVGQFSKFKFGGTIDGVSVFSHPHSDHPLTSVRMLTVGTQTCGRCKRRIDGFKDDVAFQCSTCDFWTHWYCILRIK